VGFGYGQFTFFTQSWHLSMFHGFIMTKPLLARSYLQSVHIAALVRKWLNTQRHTHVTPQRTSTTALFDCISAGRSTHGAFYHWRPHLSSDCCIGLEQFAGVGPVVSVVASFPQQTENRTFCPVLQTWLRTSHCADYYYVTSLFKLIVKCPCSLRT